MGKMGFDATAMRVYPEVDKLNHVHHAGNSSGIVDGAALMLIGKPRERKTVRSQTKGKIPICSSYLDGTNDHASRACTLI